VVSHSKASKIILHVTVATKRRREGSQAQTLQGFPAEYKPPSTTAIANPPPPGIFIDFYESSLRVGPGWRESLYRHQGCFEASDCGRLGRQLAGHPWSALRVVKSCRKTAQRPRCCSKLKQQLCIQNGTRAHYLNYLQKREGEAGKRSVGNRIG
jgi:hypothetical protein